jgi:RHS repeat-associated protein
VAPRDNLGRITQKVETFDGVTRTDDYQYDTRGRLLNVARNGDLVSVYDYDDNGNRLSLTNPSTSSVTLGSYDDQDRVMAYGSYEYTFNENGDLTSKYNAATDEETTYEYDALGALISVVLPDDTVVAYEIDGKIRRISKKIDGVVVQGFLYNDNLRISAALDGTGVVVSQFVYGDENSHSPDFMIKGGQVYRFLKDQVGSPRVLVNVLSGAVAQTLEYGEFGQILADSAPGFQPFGFAGGLYDRDTQLLRFGARDYSADSGRWNSKDPIRWHGGQENLYAYVASDPINRIDPSGLQLDQIICHMECSIKFEEQRDRCEWRHCHSLWDKLFGDCDDDCLGKAERDTYICHMLCDPYEPPPFPEPRRPRKPKKKKKPNRCETASN